MDKIREFVMGYFKKACEGCAFWRDDVNSMMYKTSYAQLDTCRDMLVDLGYSYEELFSIEAEIIIKYAESHS